MKIRRLRDAHHAFQAAGCASLVSAQPPLFGRELLQIGVTSRSAGFSDML